MVCHSWGVNDLLKGVLSLQNIKEESAALVACARIGLHTSVTAFSVVVGMKTLFYSVIGEVWWIVATALLSINVDILRNSQ